jgi:ABC-type dipeptide/oligopeptide/nickel transport system permease component
MKRMIDLPIWVIGLLGLIVAFWQSMAFLGARDPHSGVPDMMAGLSHLWWAVGAAIISIVCVVAYFVRHPRVEEEIHISR